jgi:carbon monoxide dehydrogenase subunit G
MADYSVTTNVKASAADAYAYLCDLDNLPHWDSSVRKSVAVNPERYDVTVGFYGKALEAVYEIVESTEPERIVWDVTGKANGRTVIDIEPAATGCQVTVSTTIKLGGVARLLDRGLGVALEGIGENVEKGLRKALA